MKVIRNKVYVHKSALTELDEKFKEHVEEVKKLIENTIWNIIRIDTNSNNISFLYYPKFEEDPHPSLQYSILINFESSETKFRNASKNNPPILHRKETFLKPNDKNYEKFSKLTIQEETAGLLDPKISHRIGFKKYWDELLDKKGLTIINHQLKPKTQ